jgi:hypothetical protein
MLGVMVIGLAVSLGGYPTLAAYRLSAVVSSAIPAPTNTSVTSTSLPRVRRPPSPSSAPTGLIEHTRAYSAAIGVLVTLAVVTALRCWRRTRTPMG